MLTRASTRVGATGALAVVAAVGAALEVLLGPARIGLGWDEVVYVSQATPDVPTAFFSAPRARGIPYLVAPVAHFTASTTAIRAYLVVAAALALVAAFRIWVGLLPTRQVVVAAALFSTLWPTLFYANEAMPNYWVAVLGVAAVGSALRAVVAGGRWWYAGLGVALAAVALVRPGDAVWLAIPLLVAPAWRRWRAAPGPAASGLYVAGATAIGLVAGVAQWVVEAYQRFDGPVNRLHEASDIQGGLSPAPGLLYQARALNGPLLCRPCGAGGHSLAFDWWWFLLPLLVAAGVAVAWRTPRRWPVLLATACAATFSLPYLFLVGYAAPRFLLPAYALLSFAVAELALAALAGARRRSALARVALLSLAAVFLAQQLLVTVDVSRANGRARKDLTRLASDLHSFGVVPPCMVSHAQGPWLAFYAGCGSHIARRESTLVAQARTANVALLVKGDEVPPAFVRGWPHTTFTGFATTSRWTVYRAPAVATKATAQPR